MGKRLYVGNLPGDVDGPGLMRMFAAHGEVAWASAPRDPAGRGRGFGFVEMAEEGARAAAAGLAGQDRGGGRPLVVGEITRREMSRVNRTGEDPFARRERRRAGKRARGARDLARGRGPADGRATGGFRLLSEKRLARERRLADELIAALESRFPREAFHVEGLEARGGGRGGPVVAVKLYMADRGYVLEGTVRELADGLAEEMRRMLEDAATCPFCGGEGPRHWIKLGDPWGCPCGAVAYEEGPGGGARARVWGAEGHLCLDGTRSPLTPRHMNASRGLVSAGRGADGRRMWFRAPNGAVGADLPPATRGRFEEEDVGPYGQRRRPSKASVAAGELEGQWAAPAAGPGA